MPGRVDGGRRRRCRRTRDERLRAGPMRWRCRRPRIPVPVRPISLLPATRLEPAEMIVMPVPVFGHPVAEDLVGVGLAADAAHDDGALGLADGQRLDRRGRRELEPDADREVPDGAVLDDDAGPPHGLDPGACVGAEALDRMAVQVDGDVVGPGDQPRRAVPERLGQDHVGRDDVTAGQPVARSRHGGSRDRHGGSGEKR